MAAEDAIRGHARKVYITSKLVESASEGITESDWLTGETNNSLSLNGNLIEVSDKSSGNWQKFINGVKGATVDVTVNVFDKDEKQKSILDSWFNGQKVFVFVGDLEKKAGYAFEALVSSISETNDNGDVSKRDMSLQSNGEVKQISA